MSGITPKTVPVLPDPIHPVEKYEHDHDRENDEGGVMGAESAAPGRMTMLLTHMSPCGLELSRPGSFALD